jgi:hypothetical protein
MTVCHACGLLQCYSGSVSIVGRLMNESLWVRLPYVFYPMERCIVSAMIVMTPTLCGARQSPLATLPGLLHCYSGSVLPVAAAL